MVPFKTGLPCYDHPMNDDIRHISAVISGVLEPYDVKAAFLFGSFARGEQNEESDIDLRLVCGSSMTYGVLLRISEELEQALERDVEIVTNPPERMRPRFWESIKDEEVLLYEAA